MSNEIVEKFFSYQSDDNAQKMAVAEILKQTRFQPEEEIFQGKLWEKNKVGSLIYQGQWENRPAVLKVQFLPLAVDEIEIREKFDQQNKSQKIRLPKLYAGQRYDKEKGYGFLILEKVEAQKIYSAPFANPEQRKNFCEFYQEYKENCLNEPFWEPQPNEKSSLVFVAQRISFWAKLAQEQGFLIEEEIKDIEKFFSILSRFASSLKMEFMHGHLSNGDILQPAPDEYVLLSNIFWSYRPEFYDAVFHLWAGIKSLDCGEATSEQVISYIKKWEEEYKKLPCVQEVKEFSAKFRLMMAERCLGARLVDIPQENKGNPRRAAYLKKIFQDLFLFLMANLEK